MNKAIAALTITVMILSLVVGFLAGIREGYRYGQLDYQRREIRYILTSTGYREVEVHE